MKMCMGREGESDKRESSHLHAERGCKHKLWAGTNSAADSRQRENHTPELLLTFTATHADQRCNPSPLTCRCVRLKIRRRQWLPKPVCYIIRQRGQGGREGGRDKSDRETGERLSDRQHHCVFDGSDWWIFKEVKYGTGLSRPVWHSESR